jgi:hypothetical protein
MWTCREAAQGGGAGGAEDDRGVGWRAAADGERHGDEHGGADDADGDMALAPADAVDHRLQHRGPEGGGEVVAGGADGHRDAAVADEPARAVGHERAEDGRGAEQADGDGVGGGEHPEIGRQAGDDVADAEAGAADGDGHGDAEAVGQAAHQHAAEGEADGDEGEGQRGVGAVEAEIALDMGEHDDGGPHAGAADGAEDQGEAEAVPGVGGVFYGGGGHAVTPNPGAG